jgi:hypothetical protein
VGNSLGRDEGLIDVDGLGDGCCDGAEDGN